MMVTRVFSGIQPTGTLHIGNYFGAVRNWATMQDDVESIICIVDYHAITIDIDPKTLRHASLAMATDLIACGIDPEMRLMLIWGHPPFTNDLSEKNTS